MDTAASRTLPLDPESPSLLLKWKDEYAGWFHGEPSAFVHDIEGSVVEITEGDQAIAGRFVVYYLDIAGALTAHYPLFDVMDALQVTTDYWSALLESDGRLRPELERLVGDPPFDLNLLILDRLELLPAYRGRGLGLRVLCEMIRRFSPGAGIVAMQPFPLQFQNRRGEVETDPWRRSLKLPGGVKRSALQTLRRHYAKLGFVRVPKTDLMIRSTEWPLPSLKD